MQNTFDSGRIQHLVNTIFTQFRSRTETEGRKSGVDFGITLDLNIDPDNILWLKFTKGNESHSITVPMPFIENSIEFVQQNEVLRATCPFWLEGEQRELDYFGAISQVILGTPSGLISDDLIKATPYLQRVIYGFKNDNASIIVYNFQQAINEIVHKMPLHETMMNSFVMNNRLMVVDKGFDELASPTQRLEYQVNKAKKYFNVGWTSIGLSDGALADKNYILKKDLRNLSPFGIRYHNPQRNLYSTLGMKGDEYSIISSQTSKELAEKNITRKGWNLFSAFVDIPDIFEDQIMVDNSHLDKFVTYERRYQVFGILHIKENQTIKTNDILGTSPDQENIIFDTVCDSAHVIKIVESSVSVGGALTKVYNVIVSYCRNFRDGVKITNMHGNKGVIRMADLGYAVDPRTGQKRKIDVIIGAKTVGKRRNYGQILEALTNCILEADASSSTVYIDSETVEIPKVNPIVIADDWYQPNEQIEAGLEKRGFRRDGTWDCDTYAGKVKAICGNIFWGVIKTPEDQVWKPNATTNRNGKGVRTAGLKLSHIEFMAIETRFGANSAIMDEIMSYSQGSANLHDVLSMMRAKIGTVPTDKPVLDLQSIIPVNQQGSTIIPGQFIGGTIVDEFFHPDGFVFQLPLPYMTLVDSDGETFEGSPLSFDQMTVAEKAKYKKQFVTDKLYIPNGTLRKCWRHATGKYGLSEIGVLVNNVTVMARRLVEDPQNAIHHRLYYSTLYTYFNKLSKILGTKRGEISTYGMSIRYPFSVKAVACLSTTLPKNTVEIHRSMAEIMKVKNNDVVLAERFPCLGFMSVRPQKVRVTDDPMCKYVIRVSDNSLVSQNLDFDGDVLFLAAFHTPAAKTELLREWTNPDKTCYKFIKELNERKGAPHIKEFTFKDFDIKPFADMTNDEHAIIVEKNTGVKAQTGSVIALTYNIMRMVENSDLAKDHKTKVSIEMFLEKAAQSVFEQKHGGRSLYEIVTEGVCTSDVEMLVEVGFKRGVTEKLCTLIKERASTLGIFDLVKFHQDSKKFGGGNIINKVIREYHHIYFASRACLEGTALLEALDYDAVDIPSRMFKRIIAGKNEKIHTELDKVLNEAQANQINDNKLKKAVTDICEIFDIAMSYKSMGILPKTGSKLRAAPKTVIGGGF